MSFQDFPHINFSNFQSIFTNLQRQYEAIKKIFSPFFFHDSHDFFFKKLTAFFRLSVNQNSFFTPLVVRMCFLFYSTRNENYVNNIYICLFISSGKSFPNDVKYTLYMIYIREKYLYKRKERLTELEKKVFFDRKSFEL